MHLIEIFLTSIALAMDAFTVSICKGLNNKKINLKNGLIVGLYFGFFQSLMPIIGYLLGDILKDKIVAFDHYIALILLGIIGISMIKEAKEKDEFNEKLNFKEMIILSIATSIDALVVGITLSFLQVNIIIAISLIGIITLATCFIGYQLGTIIGKKIKEYSQIIGGITLIIIGIKIFIEHLINK